MTWWRIKQFNYNIKILKRAQFFSLKEKYDIQIFKYSSAATNLLHTVEKQYVENC